MNQWQPIDTAPKAQVNMLRPHVMWGPMAVTYLPNGVKTDFGMAHWTSVGYTPAWQEEAFLPYWMPLPEMPTEAKERV